jgi:uncharacterized protein YkwD
MPRPWRIKPASGDALAGNCNSGKCRISVQLFSKPLLLLVGRDHAISRETTDMLNLPAQALLTLMLAMLICAAPVTANESAVTVNGFRAANGLKPLRSDPKMVRLARAHAQDMARRESMDHAGFMQQRGPAGARAENVSVGCADNACAILQWINSGPHRANMLLANASSYGLASAVSRSGSRYWALEFGR